MAINRRFQRNEPARTPAEPEIKEKIEQIVNVNFGDSSARLDYLRKKLDDMMNNIGQSYGERLTRELLRRLEQTVIDFHQEVVKILDRLENLEAQRKKQEAPAVAGTPIPEETQTDEFAGLSEWERRLEMKEREMDSKKSVGAESAGKEAKKKGAK